MLIYSLLRVNYFIVEPFTSRSRYGQIQRRKNISLVQGPPTYKVSLWARCSLPHLLSRSSKVEVADLGSHIV